MNLPVLPLPFETERLVLTRPASVHLDALQEAIEESFEELHPWMPWAAVLQTWEETRDFLESAAGQFERGENFVVFGWLKDSGRFALGTGLHPRNREVPSYEIGYWCRTSLQGAGYVSEAVLALVDLGFGAMGAKRLEIRCDSRNVRSAEVARRVGFEHEATLRQERLANDGTQSDTLIFSKLG